MDINEYKIFSLAAAVLRPVGGIIGKTPHVGTLTPMAKD